MPDSREIHIHLTAQPGTTVHVTIAGDEVSVISPGAGDETSSGDDLLEAAVQRLESSGASPNVHEAISGLRELGFDLTLPKTRPGKVPENYIRIMDPRYKAHGIGYITPTYFAFTRASDREVLLGLPEAEPLTSAVKFWHINSAQPGLDAAKLLKSRQESSHAEVPDRARS
jgi:hypothetical protein